MQFVSRRPPETAQSVWPWKQMPGAYSSDADCAACSEGAIPAVRRAALSAQRAQAVFRFARLELRCMSVRSIGGIGAGQKVRFQGGRFVAPNHLRSKESS